MYIKRDSSDTTSQDGYSTYNPWKWQKWSLFAIFIVLLILVIFATLRANYARIRNGRQPIMGTAWFTPPTYQQSERQYNHDDGIHVNRHNDRRNQEENMPQYTEEVGEQDLGFYDPDGKFHPNVKGQLVHPPAFETGVVTAETDLPVQTLTYAASDDESFFGLERPEQTASRQRIREYYNNPNNNNNNVEVSLGSGSNDHNVDEVHEMADNMASSNVAHK
ncbi:hypothetical protein QEN19_003578 [Hanseniaspora menglaensis]